MQNRFQNHRDDRRAAQLVQAQTIRVRLWQTRCSRARRAARRSRRRHRALLTGTAPENGESTAARCAPGTPPAEHDRYGTKAHLC